MSAQDNSVVKVRISKPAPVSIGCEIVPTAYSGGRPIAWGRYVAGLVCKEMTVEKRGFLSAPDMTSYTNSTSVGYSGNYHFEEKTISFEAQRINEADMWRIVKTVTIAALYVNGSFVAGKTAFDQGDDTI